MRRAALASLPFFLASAAVSADPVALVPLGEGDAWHASAQAYLAAGPVIAAAGVPILDAARALDAPDAAAGDSHAREAASLRSEGLAAYERLAFPKARERLGRAVARYRDALLFGDFREALAQTLHALAASEMLDGDLDRATRTLRLARRVRSDLAPSEKQFPPAVSGLFAELASEEPPMGRLRVRATPDAIVRIDGKIRGVTPLDLDVELGDHLVDVRHPGYRADLQWVTVAKKKPAVLEAVLVGADEERVFTAALDRARAELAADRSPAAVSIVRMLGVRQAILILGGDYGVEAVWRDGESAVRRARGASGEDVARALLHGGPPISGEVSRAEKPLWRNGWVWAAAGAIVVGTATVIAITTSPDPAVLQVR
ncbi:MAG: PEGA domain-containing protein [Myxococcota bacterium]